jgi:hypothetical protein
MTNPYQPPRDSWDEESGNPQQSVAESDSNQETERERISYRLVVVYLMLLVIYVLVIDYLFPGQ